MFLVKLKIFFWYFIRPRYFKHSIRLSKNYLFNKNKKINKNELIKTIDNYLISLEDFFILHFNVNKINHINYNQLKSNNNTMGGGSNIDLIYNITEFTKSKLVLETGVASGYSSLFFLKSLKNRNGHLVSINLPYPDKNKELFIGEMVNDNLKKFWTLLAGADMDILPKVIKKYKQFDIFHYDSDKTYRGKIWTLNKIWPKIKIEGFLICDDIQDNYAFIDFAKKLEIKPDVIKYKNKYIGIIKKISE